MVGVSADGPLEVAARGARPRGARPPDGAGSPVLRKAPPNPSPGPTPCTAPARGRRESGAAAVAAAPARTWAGRRWGGEEGRTPPGPPCPLAPGRERREQDIPCPGTREGRAGEENQRAAPLAGRGPSRCPQGRASQSGHPAPSPGPHDSALGAGRRGTRMAPSLQAQSPCLSSFYLAFPHLPFLCRPLCIIHCQEKGTETRKEGSRKGGAVLHPLTQPKPQGAWGRGKALVPSPPPPRNPHSRRGTPRIRNTLLLLLPRSSWGQGPHRYNRAVNIYIVSYVSLLGRAPQSGELLPQNLLSLKLE